MSLQGHTLGKYRILDPLGRGGMARVYRAYHPSLDRYVAVKVMRSDLVDDSAFLARFEREARAVARLRHTHIVQVYDLGVQDDVYYMVMELLEGDTLKARLSDYRMRDEQMPLGDIARILTDVLDGLEYAHDEGMIHRDIKPANILLTKRGQAVLTDFGIAQIVGGTRYTVSGALMGTLNYMAPEQGLEGRCDTRCDIYSLGIVLYEMLTRSVPFDADTPLAILMKHLNDPLPLPRDLDPAIPESFERVVLKALAKDPDERYGSATEMSQAMLSAAEAADVSLPDRIPLPRSFTTAEAPAESVAVLSGSARARIEDQGFAGDETDVTLQRLLEEEKAAPDEDDPLAQRIASPEREAQASLVQPKPRGRGALVATLGLLGALVTAISGAVSQAVPGIARLLTDPRGRALKALLSALGVVAGYNLLAVWIGGATGWWGLYYRGWPLELLAVSLALCLIMYVTESIWLLIPTGILLGNAIIFAYCQLTGLWEHWIFLWPLEPALIGGTVWLTVSMGRRNDASRDMARPLGCALGLVAIFWGAIVVAATVVVGVVASIGR